MNRYLDSHQVDSILGRIKENVENIQLVYIFGSMSERNTHKDSDIDIAVLSKSPLLPIRTYLLKTELEAALNKDVDLVDMRNVGIVLKCEIIYKGTLIYSSLSEEDRLSYESRIMEDYLDYKELMKPLEEDIKSRGSVY